MGDYATRLSDGQRVKIGTCGEMYYCRWEQANEIVECDFRKDNCAWRIPLPSEDGTDVGDYDYGGLLKGGYIPYDLMIKSDSFTDDMKEALLKSQGIVQSHVESMGLLVNIPCYHGIKLPEVGNSSFKVFWNGKRDPLHLCFLKNTEKELLVGIRCAGCNCMWTTVFNEIEPYIVSLEMKLRLFKQCSEYGCKHNPETPCPYEVSAIHNKKDIKMVCLAEGIYDVRLENRCVSEESSFEANEKLFRNMIDQE